MQIAIGHIQYATEAAALVPEGVRYVDMTAGQREAAFWMNEGFFVAMATGRPSRFSLSKAAKYEREMLFIRRVGLSRGDAWAKQLKGLD